MQFGARANLLHITDTHFGLIDSVQPVHWSKRLCAFGINWLASVLNMPFRAEVSPGTYYSSLAKRFEAYLSDLKDNHQTILIHTGDIASSGRDDDREIASRRLTSLQNKPALAVSLLGNHDFYNIDTSPAFNPRLNIDIEKLLQADDEQGIYRVKHFSVGTQKFAFVLIDMAILDDSPKFITPHLRISSRNLKKKTLRGGISTIECSRLKKQLLGLRENCRVIVGCHFPFHDCHSYGFEMHAENHDQLRQIFVDTQVDLVLSGHTHIAKIHESLGGAPPYIVAPTLCSTDKRGQDWHGFVRIQIDVKGSSEKPSYHIELWRFGAIEIKAHGVPYLWTPPW